MRRSGKELVVLKTHFISYWVLEEYEKLRKVPNVDVYIMLENSKQIFKSNGKTIQTFNFNGHKFKCILFDMRNIWDLGLLMITDMVQFSFERMIWLNSDFPLYIAENILPGYKNYWSLEYDIFCNGESYAPFFERNQGDEDLKLLYYGKATPECDNYGWVKFSKWAYKEEDMHVCFFPIVRMNKKAIEIFKRRRNELAHKYLKYKKPLPKKKWLLCEIFVGTEAYLNGLSVGIINEPKVIYQPAYDLNKLPLDNPQGELYHPLKTRPMN